MFLKQCTTTFIKFCIKFLNINSENSNLYQILAVAFQNILELLMFSFFNKTFTVNTSGKKQMSNATKN